MIRKNPFNFALDTVLNNDTEPKKGLTAEQADSLVSFARQDTVYRKYVDEIVILPERDFLFLNKRHSENGLSLQQYVEETRQKIQQET